MTTPMEDLDAAILTKLDPLLVANSGPLQEIIVEDFEGVDDLLELLHREKARNPVGVLSLPDSEHDPAELRPATKSRTQKTYNYLFAAIDEDSKTTTFRRQFRYAVENLYRVNVDDQSPGTATTDWTWQYISTNQETPFSTPGLIGWMVAFSVRVLGPC